MKNNYINQFQRDIMVGFEEMEFYKKELEMEKERVLKQEQSILSMQQLAENHAKEHWGVYFDNKYITDLAIDLTYGQVSIDDYKAGWRQREQHLIPIIQELAAALRYWVSDSFVSDREFNRKMADDDKAILDKYKSLL